MKINNELYEKAREYCDKSGIRLIDFMNDAIEAALSETADKKNGHEDSNDSDKQSLVFEIAMLHEKAYRRGFYQGFLTRHADGDINNELMSVNGKKVSLKELRKWRYDLTLKKAIAPPGTYMANHRYDIFAKLYYNSLFLNSNYMSDLIIRYTKFGKREKKQEETY